MMKNRPLLLGMAFAILLGVFSACNPPSGKKKGNAEKANTPTAAPQAVAPIGDISIPVGASPTKGAGENALVTIIEFSDFQCPFCNRVNDSIKQIMANYGSEVRIAFKHNPLPFHKDAPLAAQAAFAAQKQGKFWEMHDSLFANMKNLSRDELIKYATDLGLNKDRFVADMDSSEAKAQVKADMDLSTKLGARGTPHFFINGKRIPGALPYEKFKEVIDQQLIEARALLAKGMNHADAYQALVKKNFEPEKQAPKAEADSKTVYKVPVGNSYKKGGTEPLVTIIEFSEFECPFCSRVNPTIKQILDTYGDKVQVVFKHNPLPFHANAIPASKAAFAAGEQGKFWEMHDLLFANQKALKPENLEQYATQLGLDLARFKADVASSKYDAMIKADQDTATQFGARGTPGFFINGRNLRGAQPFDSFKKIIDEEISKAEALLKTGVARVDVYNKLTEKGLLKAAEQQAQAPAEDSKTVYKLPLGNSYAKGGAEPYVTIVEFSEFQCPFCTRVLPTLKQVLDTYGDKVKVVFKHNPLPFHADAPLASEAALAAGAQGKFWEMHDILFANQKNLKRDSINQYATQLGLDMSRFGADLDSGRFKADIKADQEIAAQFGAGGTPNFFINGRQLVGAQPFDGFKKIIDEEISKAEALLKTGVARADLYNKLTEKGELKAKKATPQAQEVDKTVYVVDVLPTDAFKGNANAPITIVEFSEFQCPFCSRVNPTISELLKLYPNQIKVVFKHNPLPFHADAPLASQAALAAGVQGKFWEMHDALFANQRALKRENLDQYAAQIGLEMNQFKADLDSGRFKAQVDADMALATKVGARGTPTFFVNGRKLVGAQPVDAFKALIDELLKGSQPVVQPVQPVVQPVQPVVQPVQPVVQPVQPVQPVVQPLQAPVQPVQPVQPTVQPVQPTVQPVQPTVQPVQPTVQPAKPNVEISIGNSPVKGAEKALVTIVEFSDFQCPFCSRVVPTIKQIIDNYGDKVRFSFKHNPLPFHADAPLAAQAAFAAQKQGKFWEMHDKLFENMRALKRENLEQYAQELGLDMAKFKVDIDSEEAKAQIKADQELSQKLQANGTPHFFVNGKRIPGAMPFENFKSVIEEQINAATALVQKGLTHEDAYKTLVNQNFAPEAQQQKPAQPDANAVYKILPGNSYAKGGAEPLVTIIEFSEFQCPFCSRVNPTIKQILDTYGDKVKVVFKHNPLPFHPEAGPAAEAALAAGAQGKFWEMHDILFANQKALKRENLDQYATQLGLNMDQFKADVDGGKFKAEIKADQDLAAQFGARGTPGFFINGRNLRGAQPFDNFKKIIDEEISKAEALLKTGVSKSDLYAKLTEKGLLKAAEQPKQQAPAEDSKTVYNIPAGNSYAKGGAEPYVTILEFSEFQCPFCTRVNPTVKQILETYGDKVKVVFKHNPLPFHADAPLASEAALAAGEQGKFWEMHDTLFANQKALKRENIDQYATQLGLDMVKFAADLDSGKFKAAIKADQDVANQFGARGTPNFFINGRQLTGARPFEQFKTIIDEEITKAEALLKTGVARADLYSKLTEKGLTKAAPPPAQQQPAEDNTVYPVKVNPTDAIKGNVNAPITILEFSEFQCPFCSRVNPTIEQILSTYGDKVRVVFKHNPLPFHADAPLASEAALAAGAQGKFWEMHNLLFANQRALKRENLDQYATQLGLDMAQFKADLDSNKFKAQVEADLAYAKEVGIQGTPSFIINGKKLVGAQPFESFKSKIDEALKNVK